MSYKRFLPLLGVALPAMLWAAQPSDGGARLFKHAFKPQHEKILENDARRAKMDALLQKQSNLMKEAAIEPQQLPSSDLFGYLDAPDGSTWFYTYTPTIVEQEVPGGYPGLTEAFTTAYQFDIYDNNLDLVGTIKDKVVIDETAKETKCAQVLLTGVITKKFFNLDNNYEVIVSVAMNRSFDSDVYPQVNYHSYVYGIGGQKDAEGNDQKIKDIDGYLMESVNSAKDEWSENFYMTFITETGDLTADTQEDFLNSCKNILTTYTKATYGGDISVYQEKSVGVNNLPGDQMSCPFMFTYLKDGNAYFAYSEYEKNFYLTQGEFDPSTGNFSDPIQNEGNNLVITIFEEASGAPKQVQQTKIPVVIDHDVEGALYTYYGLGNMRYDKDIDYGNMMSDSSVAAFVINKQVYTTKSDASYVESFLAYDNNGDLLQPIAEGCEGFVGMSDIKGQDPQVMFIYNKDSEYILSFVDLYTGTEEFSMGQILDGNLITSTIDRVPFGDSYRYAVSMSQGMEDENGNIIHSIGWMDAAGEYLYTDKLNLGQDVEYAQVYIEKDALNPYVFNTDADREYLALLKRRDTHTSSSLHEELSVVSTNGSTVLNLKPQPEYGNLLVVAPLDLATVNPRLVIVYRDADWVYTPFLYDLPLTKFAGGDGSVENPYQIASAGDLKQIASNISAHYVVTADIDASDLEMSTIEGQFSGSIDGRGHTISNLTIGSSEMQAGMFGYLAQGSSIRNLKFVNTTLRIGEEVYAAGVVAADVAGATIEDVHIYNLEVEAPEHYSGYFGGLVGQAALRTSISKSSVNNAEVNLSNAPVGGIIGYMRTGTTITECSFSGSINGGANVGGIVGESLTGDEKVVDCHVDADIVAKNTVGGIIGLCNRNTIDRCYVEGSIEATTANRWGDIGPCAGGIVGSLTPGYEKAEGLVAYAPATAGVVTNCFVKLESLKGYTSTATPAYDEQLTTMHRIIGYSRVNDIPGQGVNTDPEAAIFNNYAISTLAKVSDTIEAAGTTTEGADIAADALNNDFFTGELGFAFGVENPWNELSDESDPALNHETAAFFNPAVINAVAGTKFEASLVLVGRGEYDLETLAGSISVTSSDEEVAMTTGVFRLEGNTLFIEFSCDKIGTTQVVAYVNGAQAALTVNALTSGIENIVNEDNTQLITFNGNAIIAADSNIAVYSAAGTIVANGRDELNVSNLQSGIYIVVAQNAAGNRSVLKIAK